MHLPVVNSWEVDIVLSIQHCIFAGRLGSLSIANTWVLMMLLNAHPAVNLWITSVSHLAMMSASMHMIKALVPPSARHVHMLARRIPHAMFVTTEPDSKLPRVLLLQLGTKPVALMDVTGPALARVNLALQRADVQTPMNKLLAKNIMKQQHVLRIVADGLEQTSFLEGVRPLTLLLFAFLNQRNPVMKHLNASGTMGYALIARRVKIVPMQRLLLKTVAVIRQMKTVLMIAALGILMTSDLHGLVRVAAAGTKLA